MANNIPNVTVPAPVIQLNNTQYLTDERQYDPQTQNVPCGINALVSNYQWWMVPVKDYGIISILQPVPAIGENTAKPTPDSISVIRIQDKYAPYWTWWVVCTLAEYYAACAACCTEEPVPIPEPILPVIVPCQKICENSDGVFQAVFGYPADAGEYIAVGQFNGVNLTTESASTIAALVAKLNSFWTNIGSPPKTFVWTASGGVLKAVGGVDGDSLCVLILSVASSP